MATLELKQLHVALEDGTEIVKGVDLTVASGEVHAIMGPNGSGKSTLAYAIAGHPAYEITSGQILLDGKDITEAGADERAQAGLFLAFQYPHAIPGVTVTNFLRQAMNAVRKARNGGVDDPMPVPEFRKLFLAKMDDLKVSRELASRYLNDGFSGGEKKRVEILQMAMLRAEDRGARRDRLRSRHRRAQGRRGGRAAARRPRHGRARDHALPADPELHQARLRARLRRRQDRRGGRPRARREARGLRVRPVGETEGRGSRNGTDRVRDRPGDRLRLRDQVRLLQSGRGEGLLLQERTRPLARARRRDLGAQGRAGVDEQVPPQVARLLPRAPDAHVGRDAVARRDRLREHLLLHQADREPGRLVGGPARRHQGHLGQARHPRGGEELPRRRRCAVRERGRLPQAAGAPHRAGRDLPRHRHRAPRARGSLQAVLRDDHPAERQQVRGAEQRRLVGRLVHLRAEGREDRAAAPGLLPHQRGEHGPVRAHADPRRRGRVRALRRGLHRADLLDRLAAQRGRRDRRQEGRPLPLHDDPELVEQRLQPRHEARGRGGERDHGMGRRQPRLEADDEVPGDLADRQGRARRGAVDRVRRQGPASGRGRQVRPHRAEHDERDHVEVDLEERRPRRLPRAARGREGRARARGRRSSATR